MIYKVNLDGLSQATPSSQRGIPAKKITSFLSMEFCCSKIKFKHVDKLDRPDGI